MLRLKEKKAYNMRHAFSENVILLLWDNGGNNRFSGVCVYVFDSVLVRRIPRLN